MSTSPFTDDDIVSLGQELSLAIRSDNLKEPIKAKSGVVYGSAEYWVVVFIDESGSGPTEDIIGSIGLLTFYNVPDECWIGYLAAIPNIRCGAVLTDVALRRAGRRGFSQLFVWTTKENSKAIEFYMRIGFVVGTSRPRELGPSDAEFMSFIKKT